MVREGSRKELPHSLTEDIAPLSGRISKIASLKKFSDNEKAKLLLYDVVRLVAPIIIQNNFKVGILCEMLPKSANLLGLNVNAGSKILLRLRYHSNPREFLPLGDIIGTFLHELTHNLYGKHDSSFYKFLDKLKLQFEQVQLGQSDTYYRCEIFKLGSNAFNTGSVRDKRLKVLSKTSFKPEKRKLGTLGGENRARSGLIRNLALQAAERRIMDSQWCHAESNLKTMGGSETPVDGDLDIVEIFHPDKLLKTENTSGPSSTASVVIDLTSIKLEANKQHPEIIVLDD